MVNIIQNTWNEEDDQELLEYLDKDITVLSKDEILEIDISKTDVVFADTSVITELFKKNEVDILKHYPVYPNEFKDMYYRQIHKVLFNKEKKIELFGKFVKPDEANNKAFNGMIINNKWDFQYISENLKNTDYIYVCEPVEYMNEYRIFYQRGKKPSIYETTNYILGGETISKAPSEEFIKQCTKILDTMDLNFYVLDVGMIKDGTWTIVEMNPSYSLSSYDMPIEDYYEYCRQAWDNIKSLVL